MAIGTIGIGSGLDLSSLVKGLVDSERAPAVQRLDRKELRAQAQISAFGNLRSNVSGISTALSNLANLSFRQSATSSDAALVRATVNGTPSNGTFQIEVQQLARAQSLATAAFADPDDSVGSGSLTIERGSESVTFDLSGGGSLREIRDRINSESRNGSLGVNASLINDGTGTRLVLTSAETGSANTITVSVSDADGDDLDNAGLSRLAAPNLTETRSAQDAVAVINGLTVTSASNNLAGTIEGLSLELRGVTTNPVNVSVTEDRSTLRQRVTEFITAFNAFNDQAREFSKFDAEKREGSLLTGDSTLRILRSQINVALRATATPEDQAATGLSLSALGIVPQANGNLRLDESRFNAVVDQVGADAVVGALREIGASAREQVSSLTASGGLLDTRTASLNESIRRVADQRSRLDQRIQIFEQRLVKQFTALDSLVGDLQQTSNFLTSQLANLPGARQRR